MECPLCGLQIKEGQKFCTACGWDLSEELIWHHFPCGNTLDEDMYGDPLSLDFCPHCGGQISGGVDIGSQHEYAEWRAEQ